MTAPRPRRRWIVIAEYVVAAVFLGFLLFMVAVEMYYGYRNGAWR